LRATEFYYRRVWPTRARAIQGVAAWIEDRYNRRRRHSSIGHVTPVDFEMQHSSRAAEIQLAAQPVSTPRGQGQLDVAAQERGRGWAFEMAIGGLHYYEHTNPVFFSQALQTLERLLAE